MKLFTARQMNMVDKKTIESGTPGITLMRNAGRAVFEIIMSLPEIDDHARIAVVAGKGNNGGDGFRVAELFVRNGYYVSVFLLGEKEKTKGDAAVCMNDALNAGAVITEIKDENDCEKLDSELLSTDVIVDSLFGTGLKGEVEGLASLVIDAINANGATIVSVDIPSGVNASSGKAAKHCVWADFTVTFGAMKVGHVYPPGRFLSGALTVSDIGFSEDVMNNAESFANILSPSEAAYLIPQRSFTAHKGNAGRLFVLAGSVGLTGAAALASESALRVGAGLVTLGCPESLNDILEVKLTEVMTLPLPEVRKKRCLSVRALGRIREALTKTETVALGPGLGRNYETSELIRRFVSSFDGNLILDADGIYAFKGKPELLKIAPCEIVLTPHVGELSTLTGKSIDEIASDPVSAARETAEMTNAVVLLKGAPTVIATPSGTVWINPSGNESMATAGMGDVLTGVIAGLTAQGLTVLNAAVFGAYLHGNSGEIASEYKGIHGVTAGDVRELLPKTMREILHTLI